MCDCEVATVSSTTIRRARKRHVCCECGGDISAGEEYEYVKGIWDGHCGDFKTCMTCGWARGEWVAHLPVGECWPCYGLLWEEIENGNDFVSREQWLKEAGLS